MKTGLDLSDVLLNGFEALLKLIDDGVQQEIHCLLFYEIFSLTSFSRRLLAAFQPDQPGFPGSVVPLPVFANHLLACVWHFSLP